MPLNVTLSDTIPPGTSFVSASDGGAETPPGGGIVLWPLFDLPAGAAVSRTLVVDVIFPPPPGLTTIVNTATAGDDGSNGPDPNPGNNTGTDIDVSGLRGSRGDQDRQPGSGGRRRDPDLDR